MAVLDETRHGEGPRLVTFVQQHQRGLRHVAVLQHAEERRLVTLQALVHLQAALQRGLQVNERLQGDEAAFFRVLQHGDVAQTALVLLNKGDQARTFTVARFVQNGHWRDALEGGSLRVDGSLKAEVPAHGVKAVSYTHLTLPTKA